MADNSAANTSEQFLRTVLHEYVIIVLIYFYTALLSGDTGHRLFKKSNCLYSHENCTSYK